MHDAGELQHRSSSGNPIGGASTLGVRAIPPVELQRHSVRAIPRVVELQRKAFGHSHRWSFNAEGLGQSHLSRTRHVSFNAAVARAMSSVELQRQSVRAIPPFGGARAVHPRDQCYSTGVGGEELMVLSCSSFTSFVFPLF